MGNQRAGLADLKAIAMIDGFRDVSYIDTIYELVPELRTQDSGNLKSENFPSLRMSFSSDRKNTGECTSPVDCSFWNSRRMMKNSFTPCQASAALRL